MGFLCLGIVFLCVQLIVTKVETRKHDTQYYNAKYQALFDLIINFYACKQFPNNFRNYQCLQ